MRIRITSLLAALIAPVATVEATDYIWVEGESGTAANVVPNSWYQSVRKEDLSGSEWLASYGGRTPASASYNLRIPESGEYLLWVRANPIKARLEAQLGADTPWRTVPISTSNQGARNIANDGKPDMRFLAWTKVGPLPLREGALTARFKMSSANGNHGAIDCFCLTTDSSWKPNGVLKPKETAGWAAPELDDKNLRKWADFIMPSEKDLSWRQVRWHRHLDEAALEAKKLGRPILLWAMNGHPCGET